MLACLATKFDPLLPPGVRAIYGSWALAYYPASLIYLFDSK